MQKLMVNDKVQILAGKDKGKTGNIIKIFKKTSKVLVSGVNVATKAMKPTEQNPKGGFTQVERPVHASNVNVVSPKDGKPTRVRIETKDGNKVRIAVKCGSVLSREKAK